MIQLTNADRPASENEAPTRRVLLNPSHIVSVMPWGKTRTRIQTTAVQTVPFGGAVIVTENYDQVINLIQRWTERQR